MVNRASWLSVTPEPERELPEAVATLTCGRRPDLEAVARESWEIERLVLAGRQRSWLAYLHQVVLLIERRTGDQDPDIEAARSRATAVIANHHNLLLGLPGRGAAWTVADRTRLDRLGRPTPGQQPEPEPVRGVP